ncbi:MAG TPA: type VI secretion system tube protein Hcp [Actinomycetota bacterium]|nr:type VI secretion system tube protein Hcp [Actinomycetota bacterium]
MWTRAINTRRLSIASLISILFLLGGVMVNGPAGEVEAQNASADYFLKLDGIEGESLDEEHRGEIEILSYSWGMSNPTHVGSGGLSSGKVSMNDFTFTMRGGKASPKLFLYCAQGKHIPAGIITVRTGGHTFVTWELKDVVITSFKTRVDPGSGTPTEEVRMKFVQIVVTHFVQNSDGTSSVVKAGWDLAQNKKI